MPHCNDDDKKTIKEHFSAVATSRTGQIISFFWSILGLFAIYLAFKCNNGFNLGHFVAACCFPILYVPIIIGLKYNQCFPNTTNAFQ